MNKPEYGKEYYTVDNSDIYEGPQIVTMVWIDSKQNKRDLESLNMYETYEDAFDSID